MTSISRRTLLGVGLGSSLLAACSTPLRLSEMPIDRESGARAEALMQHSAEVHGLAAYRQLHDINIAYEGQWGLWVDRLQPLVVAKPWRGRSQERLMPALGINAQSYSGLAGNKFVRWQRSPAEGSTASGEVAVWFNGVPSVDPAVLGASALVAEAYKLFLLGPLWLVDRKLTMRVHSTERVDGHFCDVVEVWLRPGLGQDLLDRLQVCIGRDDSVMRRVRFTLEGFEDTKGAVAVVDTFMHQRRFGVLWPMRSHEDVVYPLHLPAHDWHISGLDVNRGYDASALQGPAFSGAAAAPAAPL
ncbi:MAG: hypothetical protein M3Y32_05230 [Pseudomonadota bacterium]|nr:hypothetical protein [Pseudomonadota bacterium]